MLNLKQILLILLTLFLSSCDPRFETPFSVKNLCKGVDCGINGHCIEKGGEGVCACNNGYSSTGKPHE